MGARVAVDFVCVNVRACGGGERQIVYIIAPGSMKQQPPSSQNKYSCGYRAYFLLGAQFRNTRGIQFRKTKQSPVRRWIEFCKKNAVQCAVRTSKQTTRPGSRNNAQ